jgi:hypothetical protein
MDESRSTLMPCLARELGHIDPQKDDALKQLDVGTHLVALILRKTSIHCSGLRSSCPILPSEREDTHVPAHAARKRT